MYTEQHDTRGVRTHALSEWRLEPPPQTARPKCLRWENKGAGYIYIYIFGHLIYQRSHMQMGGSLPTANAGSKCLRLYSNWSNMMWNLHELVPRSHTPCCSLHPEPWTPEAKALRPIQICRVNLFSGSCWQVHLTDRLALIIFVLACPNARCVHGQTLMSWCGLRQQCRNIA